MKTDVALICKATRDFKSIKINYKSFVKYKERKQIKKEIETAVISAQKADKASIFYSRDHYS